MTNETREFISEGGKALIYATLVYTIIVGSILMVCAYIAYS